MRHILSKCSLSTNMINRCFGTNVFVFGLQFYICVTALKHLKITFEFPLQSSFSKLSDASPTSPLILQPFRRFTYVTAHSPILPLLHLCHSSFSNSSFASPMSQALHLIHLASHPWLRAPERMNRTKPHEGKNAGRIVGIGIALLVVARNEYCPSTIICTLSLKT